MLIYNPSLPHTQAFLQEESDGCGYLSIINICENKNLAMTTSNNAITSN